MPSDALYSEFAADLEQYGKTLDGLDIAGQFCAFAPRNITCESEEDLAYVAAANEANSSLRDAQGGMPVLRGAMFAQSISRFEIFIKNEVEDLAVRASANAAKFSHLPKEFRDSLIVQASIVIANPKKFRMESFVGTIASVMAGNLNDASAPGVINQYCLSITSENMRPSTVDELFRRVGISDIWSRVGANADVQIVLQQPDAQQASAVCQKRLNIAMDRRNQIIHPSPGITWPGNDEVKNLVALLEAIGKAVSSNIPVFEMRLKEKSDVAALK